MRMDNESLFVCLIIFINVAIVLVGGFVALHFILKFW